MNWKFTGLEGVRPDFLGPSFLVAPAASRPLLEISTYVKLDTSRPPHTTQLAYGKPQSQCCSALVHKFVTFSVDPDSGGDGGSHLYKKEVLGIHGREPTTCIDD
ncbi:hypothetical protein PAXINDRAFT_8429 [Paxillus involutus ATCC 200175]|nr:hypothetical protein PAXINDRAFT_8429 [Paxillus involutus ATCC 200175]